MAMLIYLLLSRSPGDKALQAELAVQVPKGQVLQLRSRQEVVTPTTLALTLDRSERVMDGLVD